MAGVVLLEISDENGRWLATRRVRARDRLAARWHHSSLDRELAAGASPDDHPARALRAHRLVGPRGRRHLVLAIERILREASGPAPRRSAEAPICRRNVREAQRQLQRLADRLAAGPVDVRGVALAQALLTDSAGPLYSWMASTSLLALAEQATIALEPCL
jgi:hypothetical protein